MTAAVKSPTVDVGMILELPTDELNDLMQEIKHQTRVKEEERMRVAVTEHVKLVGKCFKVRVKPHAGMFPEMWRYYKIINARAENEYRVSALRFDEYPTYWFNYRTSKIGCVEDYYFGCYNFDSVIVEDFPFYCYNLHRKGYIKIGDRLTEISLSEYNTAMILYIDRLQEMRWPTDHYRFGGKKPGDPNWEGSRMNYSKAKANYNMGFNNGHFKQGKAYKYR